MTIPDEDLLFATAFYHAAGKSPNAWTFSHESKLHMYYRCMIVCYASLRRLYPKSQLMFFSNSELPEPFAAQLKSLEVITEKCPDHYVLDSAFNNGFPGCLYTLDVIDYLGKQANKNYKNLILIDNDCIVRSRLDAMIEDQSINQTLYAYAPGYPVNMVANGQSRASLTLALTYFQGKMLSAPIELYGGEFYAIPSDALSTMANDIQSFWTWMKTDGINIFGNQLTEEHVMSAALSMQSERLREVTTEIKRIWTTEHFSTVEGNESEISIWHLPSEKKKGLAKMYHYWLKHNGFNNLDDKDFNQIVNSLVGLQINQPKNKLIQLCYRLYNATKYIITGRM